MLTRSSEMIFNPSRYTGLKLIKDFITALSIVSKMWWIKIYNNYFHYFFFSICWDITYKLAKIDTALFMFFLMINLVLNAFSLCSEQEFSMNYNDRKPNICYHHLLLNILSSRCIRWQNSHMFQLITLVHPQN